MSAARFNAEGQFRVQGGMTWKRLEGGAVEIVLWANGRPLLEPIIVHAQDWVDGQVAVTPGAEHLEPHDWQLRAHAALQLHEARGGTRRPPTTPPEDT